MSMCKNCPRGFQWWKSMHTNEVNMLPQPPGNIFHSLLSQSTLFIPLQYSIQHSLSMSIVFPCPIIL